jgi:hypothetical protein
MYGSDKLLKDEQFAFSSLCPVYLRQFATTDPMVKKDIVYLI